MYIPFSQEQREQARQTDLAAFLHSQGETLRRSGSEQEWRDGSQKVTIRGNLWFHQYDRVGGDAVDFVRRFYHRTYPEAMEFLLGSSGGQRILSPPVPKEAVPFVLPPRSDTMRRVYGYLLRHRRIDREVLEAFVQRGMIYESSDYHNAVFVGVDPQGQPKHAHKRGTGSERTYKGNVPGSQPEYSFHWMGTSSRPCWTCFPMTTRQSGLLERPLMTPDELKAMPRGQFVVMKTGCRPMRVRLKLFFHWGIQFGEPYAVPEQGSRRVAYASKSELVEAICGKYPPPPTQMQQERVGCEDLPWARAVVDKRPGAPERRPLRTAPSKEN